MRLYTPPERWNEEPDHDSIETYHPRRPFVLAPCNICGITECGKDEDGHGSPIVISISGLEHRSTSACAVFCNINSPYNKTTLLHQPNYSIPQVELKAAVLALEQVKAFIAAEATEEAITQTKQIIIKTDSIYITADKQTRSRLKKCKHLIREFNELLTDLGEMHYGKLSIRLWRVLNERNQTAQQLAETKLAGHEETRDIRRLLYGKLEQAGWYDRFED
jgi:ribonuclease HI